ncbi:MAG TPA: carboxylating nicotinate-nucleotide diphosphorylase [Gammaproteobacteria bacterium]
MKANQLPGEIPNDIQETVRRALAEDIGTGDITADILSDSSLSMAQVICRETAILCGTAWFDSTFHQIDPKITISWQAADGDVITENMPLCTIKGPSKAILSGERTALNFLQTLSGTATLAHRYAERVKGLPVQILDTRKTLPGLRSAQKYAVRCGGCTNHRMGLYDAILIKENHILACGSITLAIEAARHTHPGITIEIEVERLDQISEALDAGADILLLDNFDPESLRKAVILNNGLAKLEASGGITLDNVRSIAQSGVDYISVGSLTKDIKAIDLSMKFRYE